MGEYLMSIESDGRKSCNCGPYGTVGTCVHIAAVESYLKAAS
jgi:hypothetical protein